MGGPPRFFWSASRFVEADRVGSTRDGARDARYERDQEEEDEHGRVEQEDEDEDGTGTGRGTGRQSAAHFAQHGDDARKEELASSRVIGSRRVQEPEDVEDGGALERRTPRDGVKTRPIGRAGLARGLGDVQRNRSTGPAELIAQVGMSARDARRDSDGERYKLDGAAVHVEPLEIEERSIHVHPSDRPTGRLRPRRRARARHSCSSSSA